MAFSHSLAVQVTCEDRKIHPSLLADDRALDTKPSTRGVGSESRHLSTFQEFG